VQAVYFSGNDAEVLRRISTGLVDRPGKVVNSNDVAYAIARIHCCSYVEDRDRREMIEERGSGWEISLQPHEVGL